MIVGATKLKHLVSLPTGSAKNAWVLLVAL